MGSIITVSNLTSGNTLTQATSYNTNSISPSANRLIFLTVNSLFPSGVPNTPTVTGASMTWTQVQTETSDHIRVTVFRALSSSPGSGVLTIDFGGQTQHDINYSIDSFTNVDTSGTNGSGAVVQSAVGTGTSATPSVTLAALQNSSNVSFGALALEAGGVSITKGSNFTELSNQNNSSTGLEVEYAANQTVVNWTNPSNLYVAIAIEVKQKNVFPGSMI